MTLKRTFFFLFILLAAVLCATISDLQTPDTQQAYAAPELDPKTPTQTFAATPSPNVEITMLFLGATDTAVAIAKTETELHAQRETQEAQELANAAEFTRQTQAAEVVFTQQHWDGVTQTHVAATATSGMATAAVTWTQGAAVGATATQHYWDDVTATQLAATQEIEQSARSARKVSIWGSVFILLGAASLGLLWLGVKVWRSWKLARAEYLQASVIGPDPQGRFPLANTDALGKDNKIVNPNLAHRAVVNPAFDDLSTEQALANTQSQRVLEATRAIAQSPAWMRQTLRRPAVTTETPMPQANLDISAPEAKLLESQGSPAWSLMEGWDGHGGIPYGVSARGLERVSIQQVPHGGIFGQTGKGKSRYFLRPFIAAAIAAGQRVVILGKQADFWPFATHPNVKMIPVRHITQAEEAARYAGYLKRIVEEMNRRDDYLTSHQVSTWDRAGRENTLIVLDELGNALDMMPRDVAQEAYRWVQGLVKEGRKAGFHVWLASQRAVGFKSIVEQLGRAVFYLSDADASRHALGMPGAETLSDGHFFAKFQGVRKCAAFDPTDEDLVSFLRGRSVQVHEPIDWIDGTTTDVEPTPERNIDEEIRAALTRMSDQGNVSLSQVQREVFHDVNTGGANFRRIQKIWIEMQAERATTTRNMPDSGAVAGSATGSAA